VGKVLRFLWNLILIVVVCVAIVLVLGTALGLILSRNWENAGLDDGNPSSTWLWLDGDPIYYQALGDEGNPVVVLVHGDYVEGSATWNTLTNRLLRSGMRVVTLDLRGYGRSVRDPAQVYSVRAQAELLATVLNNLQVRDATVVAHDLGCAAALQMALDQPQFVHNLVLIAPRLERESEPLWQWTLKVPYLRRVALWVRCAGGPGETLERRYLFADPTLVTSDYMSAVRAPTHVEGTVDALEAMVTTPADSDLPAALPQIQAPVYILLGDQDPVISAEAVS